MRALLVVLVGAGVLGAAGVSVAEPAAPAALAISGHLVHEDGTPAAGRVRLLPLPSNYDWHRGLLAGNADPDPVAVAVAGSDGRFTVAVPAAGVWTLEATVPARVPMRYSPLPVTDSVELPPLALAPAAEVEVVVRWRDQKPAADAWVLLTTASAELWEPQRADGWQVGSRLGRTDAAGRVTLPRRPGEALEVHAFAGGVRAAAAVPGDTVRAEVLLVQASGDRVVELRGDAGAPAADVVVTAGRPAWPLGITGRDGRLSLPAALEGPFAFLPADGRRYEVERLPAGDPAVVALAPLPRLAGRVLDAESGRPIAGAVVWPGDDPGAFTRTDDRGAYGVASRESGRAWVQAEARGFLPRAVKLPSAGAGRVPALALEPAAELGGRVVDAAGAPLGGAVVTVAPEERKRYDMFRRDRAADRAVSGADGRFLLRGLGPGPAYPVTAGRPGYRTARATVTAADEVRLVLAPARAAFGRVVDVEERPLEGVEVTIRPSGVGRSGDPVTAATDARGRFEVAALPADQVDLEARRRGFAPLAVPGVAVAPGPGAADLGVLVLVPGERITGRVADALDRPLAQAGVWLTGADRVPSPALADALRRREPAAVSGEDGLFAVTDLPADRGVSLLFARPGYLPAWVAGVATPPAEPLAVVLEAASRLRGHVEAETGEPVAGARVRLRPAPPPPGTVGVEARRQVNTAETRSGRDGAFAFAEVTPGAVLLEALAEGYLPGEPVAVEVPPHGDSSPHGEAPDVVLVLDRGAVVDGRVTTTVGEPIAGAGARLGPARGESDAEGHYLLSGVPLGLGALAVTHPAFRYEVREVEVRPGTNRVDVTLERGLAVSGRVVDEEGGPRPGATVTLRNRGDRGPSGFRATAGADGRFQLLAVVDGEFDLEAEAAGFAPAVHPQVVAVAGRDVDGLEMVLRRGATLSGHVRGVALEDLAALEVTAERAGRPTRAGAVDYQGRYTIPHLEAGDWHLRARLDGGRRQAEAWVAIASGDREVERDLELGSGLALDGLVLFEDRPLPRAQVGVRGLDVVADRGVATDHRGAFRVEDLEPGRYRVEVVHAERMLSQSQDLDLTADREIVIEIVPAVVAGTVLGADTGAGVEDALVYLQRLLAGGEPGPLTTVGTDAAGSFVTASLAPGRYRLTVRADGYAPAERLIDAEAGVAAEPLTIELEPTAGLWVTVLRLAGAPPSRATFVVLDDEGRTVHAEDLVLSAYGHAYLRQVPPGSWTLLVKAAGAAAALARATVPGDRVEVALPPAAPLTVRVPALLESPAAAVLSLTAADGTPYAGVEPGGVLQRTWPLKGGSVTVPDLPAGAWRLEVAAADGRAWTAAAVTAGDAAATVEIE